MSRVKTAAVIPAYGIGDGLLYSIISHNLALSGYAVDTFSSGLLTLADSLPYYRIVPHPAEEKWHDLLHTYDVVVVQGNYRGQERFPVNDVPGRLYIIRNHQLDSTKTYVENLQREVCAKKLGLSHHAKEIGLHLPEHLKGRKYRKRVAIHPLCSVEQHRWPWRKYHRLAGKLREQGFDPIYILSEKERLLWQKEIQRSGIDAPLFSTLTDLAHFLYESGFFIGNDSGIGHLSSCVGLPTLTLHRRGHRAPFWRPGWTEGRFACASQKLPRCMRIGLWKQFLSVSTVHRIFAEMQDQKGTKGSRRHPILW